ncbi:hypothetical protein FIM08_03755 [SAR202 cluster bacterium AC-647-N09_OGT_505m]|nr:hypothetical protein [SAR202 cluster bacterium AC-647-N09_OGT_505m]
MSGILTEVQKQEFLDMIKAFGPVERRILIGRDVDTDITYDNVWSLYHFPALRFGLSEEHGRILENIGREFGYSTEEIGVIEAKALLKIRHPSRSRKLKNILDHTQF